MLSFPPYHHQYGKLNIYGGDQYDKRIYTEPVTQYDVELKFALLTNSRVSIRTYNVLGQEVSETINGVYGRGGHTVKYSWSPSLAAGTYFFKMESDQKSLLYFKAQFVPKSSPNPKPKPISEF